MTENAPVKLHHPAFMVMTGSVKLLHLLPRLFGRSFFDPAGFHQDLVAGGTSTLDMIKTMSETGEFPLWISNPVMGSPYLGLYLTAVFHPAVAAWPRGDG